MSSYFIYAILMITCQGYAAHAPIPDPVKCTPVELASTKNLIKLSKGYKGLCTSKDGIEGYKLCRGTCDSGHEINEKTNKAEPFCNCCRMEQSEQIPVNLTCDDKDVIPHQVLSHIRCSCQSCKDNWHPEDLQYDESGPEPIAREY